MLTNVNVIYNLLNNTVSSMQNKGLIIRIMNLKAC